MAGKKSTVRRDRYINRYRGRLTTGADSTTCVYSSFNTGMNVGRVDPMKWVITHFAMWPNGIVHVLPHASGQTVKAQLALGNQTALLDGDDMQLICEAAFLAHEASAVSYPESPWPLRGFLPAPVPVFAQSLTVLFDSAANVAGLQSKSMVYEIGYIMAPITQDEIVEYLSAFGQV